MRNAISGHIVKLLFFHPSNHPTIHPLFSRCNFRVHATFIFHIWQFLAFFPDSNEKSNNSQTQSNARPIERLVWIFVLFCFVFCVFFRKFFRPLKMKDERRTGLNERPALIFLQLTPPNRHLLLVCVCVRHLLCIWFRAGGRRPQFGIWRRLASGNSWFPANYRRSVLGWI